ncbi:hypothetical protein BV898_11218 [Hypsibius exemplaris]|uniref:Uncharacterized protein n=1 Tax=Hypsibius exemplaris TaxID=2072580 RepID=A0A1W0WHD6_HYPEX|nr:hypothetical protein BV898_11218 [Hypsibius exemplaris]
MAASAKPEDCDWTGITKRSILADGSVQQEYLRCSSGRITWLYPEGALRITIHSPHHLHPSNNNNNNMKTPSSRHRVCLTVTDPHSLQGVNVYLQQDTPKPRLVFSTSPKKTPSTIPIPNGNSSDRKCFIQTSSVVTVYMESYLVEGLNFIPASSSGKGDHHLRTRVPSIGATEILYDIQAL